MLHFGRLRSYLEMVRFSHTLFALPFALLSTAIACCVKGRLLWLDLAGILLCMVFARSAAMAFNRVADRHLDAANPRTAGSFSPDPLSSVALEDPALSRGPNKVVMWSFPIVKDGLIYVVDIRNGLFVLRFLGPHSDEVDQIQFLEANSNLGDALELFED